MAKIYLSYGRGDAEFASELAEELKLIGHEVLNNPEVPPPGKSLQSFFFGALGSIDIFIPIISENYTSSLNNMLELGAAKTYASSGSGLMFFPIIIDASPAPRELQDTLFLRVDRRDITKVVYHITSALSLRAANEAKAAETAKKIEESAESYIDEAVSAQKKSRDTNNRLGMMWYLAGFAVLILGILSPIVSFYLRTTYQSIPELITIAIANVIAVGFLGASSKYAFSLGKSYVSEALKASDRLHAIEFGKFYLKVFRDKLTWPEVKEAFQHWNIDRSSTFSSLDASQIDPQILAMVGQLVSTAVNKVKSTDTK